MAPRSTSSMAGCVAAVMAMVSPSQPRPAVIQRTSIPGTAGGVLLWFLRTSAGVRLYETNVIAPVRQRVVNILSRLLHVSKEEPVRSSSFIEDFGGDSLDMVELVMELEEEFEFTIPDAEAQQ